MKRIALLFLPLLFLGSAAGQTSGGQDLNVFLKQLQREIESHQWLRILDRSDPVQRREQVGHGMSHIQYVAELLGLNMVGNSIHQGNRPILESDLNRIRRVTWERSGPSADVPGWTTAIGTARLRGGRKLRIQVELVPVRNGWMLTGGVG